MKTLIAIVGMAGAGKSEACAYFRDQLHFSYLRFGQVVVEEGVMARGLEVNEKNERTYREEIRKELGMAAIAIKIDPRIEQLQKEGREQIILDGLYSWEEYEYLKKKYPELLLICIYATPKTRYERLGERPVRPFSPQEARARDIAELVNIHKGPPIALADFLVVNEGSLKGLHCQLGRVWEQVQRGELWTK